MARICKLNHIFNSCIFLTVVLFHLAFQGHVVTIGKETSNGPKYKWCGPHCCIIHPHLAMHIGCPFLQWEVMKMKYRRVQCLSMMHVPLFGGYRSLVLDTVNNTGSATHFVTRKQRTTYPGSATHFLGLCPFVRVGDRLCRIGPAGVWARNHDANIHYIHHSLRGGGPVSNPLHHVNRCESMCGGPSPAKT